MQETIVNKIPRQQRLRSSGDSSDWFNLGAQLGRSDEYALGLKVNIAGLLQEGTLALVEGIDGIAPEHEMTLGRAALFDDNGNLKLAPPNIDLLAHSLSYASKLGYTQLVSDLLHMAQKIPAQMRNWRYYQFVGEVYIACNEDNSFEMGRNWIANQWLSTQR